VYDGHGGAEVAIYLSRHFPDLLKNTDKYKAGEWKEALTEAYLTMDESIKSPEVITEVIRLSKLGKDEDPEEGGEDENVGALYEEATMPLEMLIAKYNKARQLVSRCSGHDSESDDSQETPEAEEGPSSSKASASTTTSPEKVPKEEPAASNSCGSSSSSSSNSKTTLPIEISETEEKALVKGEVKAEEVKKENGSIKKEEDQDTDTKETGK
jgi:hypothetical protein